MLNPSSKQPVFFISHGGGPWPWMPEVKETVYGVLTDSLTSMLPALPQRPTAILMISAHWEASQFTVQTALQPPMIYDYGNFPPHTYHIQYASAGSAELAQRVVQLLTQANITVEQDPHRGYDHGMFSPMQVINPQADIPVVQLSLKKGLDPQAHIELGRALAPLRDENILIIASGLSYHNLRMFNPQASLPSKQFDDWLYNAVVQHDADERQQFLTHWEDAPAARIAHPREEHLLPLMVAAGAAEHEKGQRFYHETAFVGGLAVSSFVFGDSTLTAVE
ncbi:MAG: class III extradiol ring-cleavage dioxygenase [Acinetobacter sp.]